MFHQFSLDIVLKLIDWHVALKSIKSTIRKQILSWASLSDTTHLRLHDLQKAQPIAELRTAFWQTGQKKES